jgi:hypothetical protein
MKVGIWGAAPSRFRGPNSTITPYEAKSTTAEFRARWEAGHAYHGAWSHRISERPVGGNSQEWYPGERHRRLALELCGRVACRLQPALIFIPVTYASSTLPAGVHHADCLSSQIQHSQAVWTSILTSGNILLFHEPLRIATRGNSRKRNADERVRGLRLIGIRSRGDGAAARKTSTAAAVFSGFAAAKAARTGEPYGRQNCWSCCAATAARSIPRSLRVLPHHTAANQR